MTDQVAMTLLAVLAINIAAWMTPGPNMLAVISASLAGGRRAGLLLGLGLNLGGFIWACLAVAGVSVVFEAVPALASGLKLAGAAYLVWLGRKALPAGPVTGRAALDAPGPAMTATQAFRTGFLVMATNPKAALFFGSVLTAFVPPHAPSWLLAAIVATCLAVGLVGHAVTATIFSLPVVTRRFDAAGQRLRIVFGIMFAGFGLAAAWDAVRRAAP